VRGAAQRAAGLRYQTSRPGRFAHAARARRYRARAKIVTHQGSAVPVSGDPLPLEAALSPSEVISEPALVQSPPWRCIWCRACGSLTVRLGFLRQRRLAPDRPIGAIHHVPVNDHYP